MRIPPYDYAESSTKTYYSGSNQSITMLRKGFMREIHFWNCPRANANGLVIDTIDEPEAETVDTVVGIRDASPEIIRIQNRTISCITTGNNIMGHISYIAKQSV